MCPSTHSLAGHPCSHWLAIHAALPTEPWAIDLTECEIEVSHIYRLRGITFCLMARCEARVVRVVGEQGNHSPSRRMSAGHVWQRSWAKVVGKGHLPASIAKQLCMHCDMSPLITSLSWLCLRTTSQSALHIKHSVHLGVSEVG